MSIDLDFFKRYGAPKYRIHHKLRFEDGELYVVQEKLPSGQEMLNDRLGRDTFSRATKLYPRKGPWAEVLQRKIANNYPAFRPKSSKEVRSITERVYKPTHSHEQRCKGDCDPDVPCPPHQKRMTHSATYWQKRSQSTTPPEGAVTRPYTSCSKVSYSQKKSWGAEKHRPKSCPPPSKPILKQSTGSRGKAKKNRAKGVENAPRRSLFNFLNEDFGQDGHGSDQESNKSEVGNVRKTITFDDTMSNSTNNAVSEDEYSGQSEKSENSTEATDDDSHSEVKTNDDKLNEEYDGTSGCDEQSCSDLDTDQNYDTKPVTEPRERHDKSEYLSHSTGEDEIRRHEESDTENVEKIGDRRRSSLSRTSSRSSQNSRNSSRYSSRNSSHNSRSNSSRNSSHSSNRNSSRYSRNSSHGHCSSRQNSPDSVTSKDEKKSVKGTKIEIERRENNQNSATSEKDRKENNTTSEGFDDERNGTKSDSKSQSSLRSYASNKVSAQSNNAGNGSTGSRNGSRVSLGSKAAGSRDNFQGNKQGSRVSVRSERSGGHGIQNTTRSHSAVSVKSQQSKKSVKSQHSQNSAISQATDSRTSTGSRSSFKDIKNVEKSRSSRRNSHKDEGSQTSLKRSPYNKSIIPNDVPRPNSSSSIKSKTSSTRIR